LEGLDLATQDRDSVWIIKRLCMGVAHWAQPDENHTEYDNDATPNTPMGQRSGHAVSPFTVRLLVNADQVGSHRGCTGCMRTRTHWGCPTAAARRRVRRALRAAPP